MTQKDSEFPTPPDTWKTVPFEIVSENWDEYNLPDGNILQLRTVLLKLYDMGVKLPVTGEPAYFYHTKVVGRVLTPKHGAVRRER